MYDRISHEDLLKAYKQMEKNKILEKYNLPDKPSTDGYYHIYVRDFTKKTGRKNIKAKTIEDLKEKIYFQETASERQTFGTIFKLAQEEKLKYIKDPEKLLSAKNTIGRNERHYNRFFLGTKFSIMQIQNITKRDVESICMDNLIKYNLRKKAFASLRGILNMTFKYAYDNYLVMENVYTRIDFKKYNSMLDREVPIETRMHNIVEVDRILQAIHEKQIWNPEFMPAYALELQMAMGLRRGEVPPLMWSDVHDGYIEINKELITVRKSPTNTKDYDQIVQHTKTWKDRRYPITNKVSNIIERLSKVSKGKYLFPADTPTGVINNRMVYGFYNRTCKKLGIKLSHDCIKGTHSFRRNAISDVVNASNGNIMLASKLFGNTPEIATVHYYTGLDLDAAKNIIDGNQTVTTGNQKK